MIKSVKLSLNNYLSQGPILKKFENKISNYFNAKYSIAVSSATAGLHLAVMSEIREKFYCILACTYFCGNCKCLFTCWIKN